MKKVLLSLVALVAMVACNNEETVVVDSNSLITFDNSFVEVKTRVEDPSITTASIDAFDVWGFIDQPSGIVFSQEHVTKNAEKNEWEYANKQYWLPDNHYFFFAVAPANAIAPLQNAPIVVKTTGMNDKGLGTIEFTNENGTLDLLYAEQDVDTAVINDPGKVSLQFMHLLSKVMFTFKNAFTNNNATLKVTGLKITDAPKNGSVAVNDVRTNYTWNIPQDSEITTLDFGNVNGGERFKVGESKGSERARLTIPAGTGQRYNVVFKLELYYGDELAGTSNKSVYLEGQEFAIGKNYNIVAEIGPKNFADNPLESIEFDVITVETWEDGVINGNLDFTDENGNQGGNQGGNEEPENPEPENPEEPTQPVALATPVVTATVDVNVVTLTWEAIDGAAEYTVQVDDDVVETVNATTYTFNGDYEVEYTFTVKAIAADKAKNTDSEEVVVKATTEAKPADPVNPEPETPEYTSVADFLAAAEDETIYTLKGTITSVIETTYGNFYINDGTAEVLIYGLLSPEGEKKYWEASGAKVGDDIIVKTVRTSYNSTPQGKDAIFVDLITPGTLAFWSFEATSVSFTAAAANKEIAVAIYNAKDNVVATSDNAQFSASYANGILTVSARENTAAEAVSGNITVTCGTLNQVITVSQLEASSGEQVAAEATISFADKANRTYYDTSKQVWEQNGITVTNVKGSSTSNVGDYVAPARFYKSSDVTIEAPGNIISIAIDCKGIEAKYVTPWGTADNGIVTITLDGSSKSYEFKTLSAQARANSITVTYLE